LDSQNWPWLGLRSWVVVSEGQICLSVVSVHPPSLLVHLSGSRRAPGPVHLSVPWTTSHIVSWVLCLLISLSLWTLAAFLTVLDPGSACGSVCLGLPVPQLPGPSAGLLLSSWLGVTASFPAVLPCLLLLSLTLGPSLSVCVSHILGSSICRSLCFRVCVLAPPHSPSQLWAKTTAASRGSPALCYPGSSLQEGGKQALCFHSGPGFADPVCCSG
jgi:hypothetical protein